MPLIVQARSPLQSLLRCLLFLTATCWVGLTVQLSPLRAEAEPESTPAATRTIIAERMTTVDGVPTMLEVEIRAPAIEADRPYSQPEMQQLLKRFVGHWKGRIVISLIDGRQVADMAVEQHYWLDPTTDGRTVLKGTAAYLHNDALSYAQSESWIEGDTLYSKITEQETDRFYEGRIQENGETITWVPAASKGETHTEQITEYFGSQNQQRTILTLGFRQHIRPEYETLLVIEGELLEFKSGSTGSETIRGRVGGQLLSPTTSP